MKAPTLTTVQIADFDKDKGARLTVALREALLPLLGPGLVAGLRLVFLYEGASAMLGGGVTLAAHKGAGELLDNNAAPAPRGRHADRARHAAHRSTAQEVVMADKHTLGDAPIEERYREQMNELAHALDSILNKGAMPLRNTGFVLLVFPFSGHEGRCNYISNAEREDIVVLLREQLARFQGMPEAKGHA